MKKIALIAPAGPLSRLLNSRLSELREARVGYYETPPRDTSSSEPGVEELWYIRHSSESLEANQKSIADLLAYASAHKIPLVNYVSSIFSTCPRDLSECGSGSALPLYRPIDVCHRYNEAVLQSSGRHLRVFRLPVLLEEPSEMWLGFLSVLLRFRQEIEDRISGYFQAHPLRVNLSPGIAPLLSTPQAVEAMVEISNRTVENNECFHIVNPHSVSLERYFSAIEQSIAVRVITAEKQNLNTIDQLFGLRMNEFVPYLNAESVFSCEQALMHSPSLREVCTHPVDVQGAVVSGFAACKAEEDHHHERRSRIWSCMEKRHAVLPDGTILNYYAGGKGTTPMVVLNAFGQGFGYWTRFVTEIFQNYKLILWVPRGNDFESIGLQAYSPLSVHADDLHAILEQEKIHSCNFLAWCTGAKLAIEYCLKYPQTVASMVFVAGSFKGPAEHRSLETTYEKGLEALLGMVKQQPQMAGPMIQALKNVLLAQNTQETESGPGKQQELLSSGNKSLKNLVLEPFISGETVLAYANQLRNFWDTNFTGLLNTIKVPMLCIGGDCDRIASQSITKHIARLLPQARYTEVAGGSHYIQYSYPDLLAGIVKNFLDDGIQFSFHHPWVKTSDLNAEDSMWRTKDDRKNNDREENQGNISSNEPAPVSSYGAGVR